MAKTSGELETEFIETAKAKTGKTLQEWLTLVKASKIQKQNDILEWLKKGHGLNHMQSQFVAGIFLNNGNPVYGNENALLENQFVKCPDMRSLFDAVSEKIVSEFQGTQLIPKKTYLSFTAVREFAAINVKPKEIRLGLDLGEVPFTEGLQKSKLTGTMPRISHMIILADIKQFDSKTKQLLEQSFNRTHKK
jgi:predicted transport protein